MEIILPPWQLLLVILAGWMNPQLQEVIDYLRTKNQVFKKKFGKKRILLDDDQRRRLATNPHESCLKQAAREITSGNDGFLNDKRYLTRRP